MYVVGKVENSSKRLHSNFMHRKASEKVNRWANWGGGRGGEGIWYRNGSLHTMHILILFGSQSKYSFKHSPNVPLNYL